MITQADFETYYEESFFEFSVDGGGDFDLYGTFPYEAVNYGSPERLKTLNALYRFIKSGLLQGPSWTDEMTTEHLLNLLAQSGAPDNQRETQFIKWIDWTNPMFSPTSFGVEFCQKTGMDDEHVEWDDNPKRKDFYNALNKIFTEHGVGFEKGEVFIPQKP